MAVVNTHTRVDESFLSLCFAFTGTRCGKREPAHSFRVHTLVRFLILEFLFSDLRVLTQIVTP